MALSSTRGHRPHRAQRLTTRIVCQQWRSMAVSGAMLLRGSQSCRQSRPHPTARPPIFLVYAPCINDQKTRMARTDIMARPQKGRWVLGSLRSCLRCVALRHWYRMRNTPSACCDRLDHTFRKPIPRHFDIRPRSAASSLHHGRSWFEM